MTGLFTRLVDKALDGLARLGLLRGGAVWWRRRWEQRIAHLGERAVRAERALSATHRMCRECRSLVPNRLATCPDCGTSMRGIPRGGVARAVSWLTPSLGSASTTLLGAIVALYAASVLAFPGGNLFQPSREALASLGTKWTPAILHAGEWWRLVNPVFLHGSLIHLLFNAYALSNLGPLIEYEIGSRRFLPLFIGCGVFSFIVSALWNPLAPSVGASGAIFGLIGFGIVHGYRQPHSGFRRAAPQLVFWGALNLVFGFLSPVIDQGAHVGGMLAGALLGLFVKGPRARSETLERVWGLAAALAGLLPLAGLLLAILGMKRG